MQQTVQTYKIYIIVHNIYILKCLIGNFLFIFNKTVLILIYIKYIRTGLFYVPILCRRYLTYFQFFSQICFKYVP